MKRNIVGTMFAASTVLLFQGGVQAQTTVEELGGALYFDQNLSLNRNQACSSCHDPDFGFVDPDNVVNGTPVSDGSLTTETGGLNSPSAAYAAFSPFFFWDGVEGLYIGGQFWNGRANTLAEQAAGPFPQSRRDGHAGQVVGGGSPEDQRFSGLPDHVRGSLQYRSQRRRRVHG